MIKVSVYYPYSDGAAFDSLPCFYPADMPQLRIALCQVDVTVGALAANADLIVARTAEAVAAGAHLVAFPEMALTGYPVEDLALRRFVPDGFAPGAGGIGCPAGRRGARRRSGGGRVSGRHRNTTARSWAVRPGRRRTRWPSCTAAP